MKVSAKFFVRGVLAGACRLLTGIVVWILIGDWLRSHWGGFWLALAATAVLAYIGGYILYLALALAIGAVSAFSGKLGRK